MHSEIAEEDLNKLMNNSPVNTKKKTDIGDSMDDVNAMAKEAILQQNSQG
jgi:hypothetical protein